MRVAGEGGRVGEGGSGREDEGIRHRGTRRKKEMELLGDSIEALYHEEGNGQEAIIKTNSHY